MGGLCYVAVVGGVRCVGWAVLVWELVGYIR